MCLVVNVDLVVPAVISSEFLSIQCLNGYDENKDKYLETMTISARQIMSYASRMKSWDLGRVVINFESEDAERYLRSKPDLFSPTETLPNVYSVILPQSTGTTDKESSLKDILQKFVSNINYSPRVLRTVGLLHG